MLRLLSDSLVLAFLLTSFSFGQQAPIPTATAPLTPRLALAKFPQPPVPSDQLELVTNGAQPVQDATQRASIIGLLQHAKQISNLRMQPYHLKTVFTVHGSTASDGNWQMENIAPGNGQYHWTAQGPGYSVTVQYRDKMLYSNQSTAALPLRLSQIRHAIFNIDSIFGTHASIRTATANLNGMEVSCALAARMMPPKTTTSGRTWEEAEFCLDPKTGLLMTYSPVPGYFVQYGYSNAIHFHDKIIPDTIAITEAGRTVIEARNESVTDPNDVNPSLFDIAGLNALGVGPIEAPPSTFRSVEFVPAESGNNNGLQIVVLHAMVAPDGQLSDTEILSSSNSAFNQRALERLGNRQGHAMFADSEQPGASPQSHEGLFTFEFAVTQPQPF